MKEQNTNSQNEKREHKKIPIFSSLKFKMVLMLIVATAVTAATLLLIMVPFSERQIKNETKNYMYDIAQSSCSILDTMTSTDDAALKEHFQNVGVKGVSSSYAYIVSSDGTMLYHPTAEKIGKSVENAVIKGVVSELKNGQKPENKVVTYDFNGGNKYAAYNISKDQSKIVVISADESEVLQPVNNMMKLAIFALIVVVVIVSAIGIVITEIALRPIIRVSQIVQKMAVLDFSENENTEKMKKRKDETGVMTRSVALLREELVNLLEGIQKQSVQLFKTSANLDGVLKSSDLNQLYVDVYVKEATNAYKEGDYKLCEKELDKAVFYGYYKNDFKYIDELESYNKTNSSSNNNTNKVVRNNSNSYYNYNSNEYIIPDSDSRYLTRYTKTDLGYIRNEIFARYGYVFSKAKYRNYFGAKSWYYPDPTVPDDESILNNVERANVHLIKSME